MKKRNLLPSALVGLSILAVGTQAKASTITPVSFNVNDSFSAAAAFQVNAYVGPTTTSGLPVSPLPVGAMDDPTGGATDGFIDILFIPTEIGQNVTNLNNANLIVNGFPAAPFDAKPGQVTDTADGFGGAVFFQNGTGGFSPFQNGAFNSTIRSFDQLTLPTKASGNPFITAEAGGNTYFFFLEEATFDTAATNPDVGAGFGRFSGNGIVGACVTDAKCTVGNLSTFVHELDFWNYTFIDDIPLSFVTDLNAVTSPDRTDITAPLGFNNDFTITSRFVKDVPEPTSVIATAIAVGAGLLTTRRKKA